MSGAPFWLCAVGLTVGYGCLLVFEDVDLEVGSGEIVAVLGVNGVGKSTLLCTLFGLLLLRVGIIELDGCSIVWLWSA